MILLKPAPTFKDYTFEMDKNEGILDMLDINYDEDMIQ